MADVEATHVVYVELNREEESRFYNTGTGISDAQRIVVEVRRLLAEKDPKVLQEDLQLQ